jgi:hypothetical protein
MTEGSSFTGKTLPKDIARIGEGNALEKPVKLFGKWDTEGCVWLMFLLLCWNYADNYFCSLFCSTLRVVPFALCVSPVIMLDFRC